MNDMDIVAAVQRLLAEKLGRERFELWFGSATRLTFAEGKLLVEAANKFSEDWLRRHYRRTIEGICSESVGNSVVVEFRVDKSLAPRRAKDKGLTPSNGNLQTTFSFDGASSASADLSLEITGCAVAAPVQPILTICGVNNSSSHAGGNGQINFPRRRFATLDGFVVGPTNRLAHASAQSIAERPGTISPFVIHGPHGCGKTHLLEGIWTMARRTHLSLNVVYLSAEQFTTLFVTVLRGGGLPSFRRKYRDVDMLLIDDLQFLSGKQATMVELLHTIDHLQRQGRQIVFASDRAPAELTQLGPELITRLSGGMVCNIDSPELQTRIGLVREFVARLSVKWPDDVLQFIAAQIASGARELAGAVNRLHAESRVHGCEVNLGFASEKLAESLRHHAKTVRLADVERAVCDVFGLAKESLQSARRSRSTNTARMLAMWLARKYTRAGLAEIGQYFGRRSHSTVITAHRKVSDWMTHATEIELSDSRCKIDEAVRRVESQIRAG